MIKGKIFAKCKRYFEEYLFGFDQTQLQMSFITGNINLNNVNIRPDKVNELFAKHKIPIALKAGLISKLTLKVNLLNLFSESLRVTVEDILFIVGPNISHMSRETDFDTDINSYDENNPMNNLVKMHQKVKKLLNQEQQLDREKAKVDKQKKKDKLKAKIDKKKKGDLKEPPMKIIINLLGGLKLEVKRIHLRYEDDYFQHHSPFAFGIMIDQVLMDNSDTDWTFDTPLSMGFVRNKPFNTNTVNKELNIKNIKAYWNSMSEMFVPTSLWEQTRHLKFQIFEAMDASFLKDIMIDAFGEKSSMNFNYLLAPFTIYTSINLNKSFRPQEDPYKYQINTLISALNVNLNPNILRDILKFQSFLEMFSYCKDLKRFRPPIRIQSFIDTPAYTPVHKKKRAQLIRDWFKFILWYVRLRRAAKGQTPFTLLEVEESCQQNHLQNAILKIKRARLEDYHPYYGSDEDEDDQAKLTRRQTDIDIDLMEQYEKQEKEIKKTQFIKDLLGGFKFSLKLEGVKAKVFTNKKIKKQHQELPQLEFDMSVVAVLVGIQNQHIIAKVLMKEIKLLDYYKREQMRAFSRQVHNILDKNGLEGVYSNIDDRGRTSAQVNPLEVRSSTVQLPQTRGTFAAGMKTAFSSIMGGSSGGHTTPAQPTPSKSSFGKLSDIIYGSSNDRSAAQSRQINPNEYFSFDIPDPTQAHHKTRETMTLSDILSNQPRQSHQYNQSTIQTTNRYANNAYMDVSPSRPSKIVKAQQFQSPAKQTNERQEAMKHAYLNQRSEVFVDDHLESVEKRCFFLMCGKQTNDSTISIDVAVNAFDDPGIKKKITLGITLDHIIIEYCNEILKSLTSLGLQYKIGFNYADLKKAPGKSKLNKKRTLQRMLELQAPLYTIKKLLLKRSLRAPVEAVINYQKHFYIESAKSKTNIQKQKELKEKQFKTIEKIKKLDKQLIDLNFDVGVNIKTVYLGLTGDKEDPLTSNQTLLEFGIDNQSIHLIKEDFKCKVSVFGISVTTLNTFEMLFTFANKLKKVTSMYKDNLAIQTSLQNYKEFIKNIQQHLDKKNKQKQIDAQKELMKKNSQPRIVIMDDSKSKFGSQIKVQEFTPAKQKVQFQDTDKAFGAHAPNNGPSMGGGRGSQENLGLRYQPTMPKDNQNLALRNQPTMPVQQQHVKANPNFYEENNRVQGHNNGSSARGQQLNPSQFGQMHVPSNQMQLKQQEFLMKQQQQQQQQQKQQYQQQQYQVEEEFKEDYDDEDEQQYQQEGHHHHHHHDYDNEEEAQSDDDGMQFFDDKVRVRNHERDDIQFLAQQRRR